MRGDSCHSIVIEAKLSTTEFVLSEQRRPDQKWVICIHAAPHPGIQQGPKGVSSVAAEDSSHDVRSGAHVQADTFSRETIDKSGNFDRSDAVKNSCDPEQIQCGHYVFATVEFAEVRRDLQTTLAGDSHRFDKLLRWVPDLVVPQAEADDSTMTMSDSELGQLD